MDALDIMNFQLIDSTGATRDPPTFAVISVTSVVAGDRVAVYRTTAGTDINEAMYVSAAGNNAGDSDFVVTGAIANDTPTTGVLELVANTSVPIRQFRVRYASWATSTFTMPTAYAGNTTAGGGATVITDGGATFNVDDIEYGDIVRNTTDGSWAQVVSVDGPTQVTTTALQDGATNLWNNLDVYEFNTLPFTFTITTDKAYVPFIDAQAVGTSVSVTVIYVADRTVLIRVRKKFILPFETPNTVTSTGMTQAAIRTPDTIAT
jgi:hypothetical protein